MSKAIQSVWANASSWVHSPAETSFSPIVMNYGDDGFASTEEAQAGVVVRRATTFSNLSVNVRLNALTTASTTVYFRKNGANGNQSVVIPALSTGVFTDVSNSDTLASGDAYCVSPVTAAGGAGTLTFNGMNVVQNDATGAAIQFCNAIDVNLSVTASTTYYVGIAGLLNVNTSLAAAEVTIDVAGVWSGLSLHVAANARTSDTVFRTFINGAAGNQTFTVSAGSTGDFSDLVNTDTIAAGDKICVRMVTGAGAGAFGPRNIASTFVASSGRKTPLVTQSTTGIVRSGSSTSYHPLGGVITPAVTFAEADVVLNPRFSGKVSYMRVGISANSQSAGANFYLRQNGANTALAVAIPASTTGIFSDTSNEVTFSAGDNLNFMWTDGGIGSATLVYVHVLIEDVETSTTYSQVIFF